MSLVNFFTKTIVYKGNEVRDYRVLNNLYWKVTFVIWCAEPNKTKLAFSRRQKPKFFLSSMTTFKESLLHCTTTQWRIQDFPEEGAPTPQGGANIRFCQNFPKTAWNWKNLDPQGRGSASLAPPPLDPPLQLTNSTPVWLLQREALKRIGCWRRERELAPGAYRGGGT